MKKRGALTLIALTAVLAFAGCKKEEKMNPFDYVTLGQYKGVEITLDNTDVTDEEIDTRINKILNENLEYNEVSRSSQEGDKLKINITGEVDGKVNDGFTSNDYELVLNNQIHIMDGFVENLYDVEPGKEVEFTVTVPETFLTQDLIGKDVDFKVKVSSVSEPKTPELTDEFVAKVSEKTTVDEFRDYVKETLESEKEAALENSKKIAALDTAISNATIISYPEGAVDDQIAEIQEKYQVYASMQNITVDQYIENNYGDTVQAYAEELVKQELVLAAIQKQEKISISNSEYKEKLPEFAEKYSLMSAETFEENYGKETIKQAMLWDKTMDFLVDNAIVK